MSNILESFLRYVDSALGLDRINSINWLLFVAVCFFILTSLLPNFQSHRSGSNTYVRKLCLLICVMLASSIGVTVSAFVSSYLSSHFYCHYVALGLIAQLFCSFILACSWQYFNGKRNLEFVKKFLMHFNAIVIIFILAAKWLIRGVDAEETSADTLNIFFNGHFEYSMHAGWYDLAPVDSIIKVALLNITGNNYPYSPL